MDFFSPIKAFRTCYDTFELGKGGPELEPHRISYGYVSRVFEAAAEAVLALTSAALSSDAVSFICACGLAFSMCFEEGTLIILSSPFLPRSPVFKFIWKNQTSRETGSRGRQRARTDYRGGDLRRVDR